MPKHGGYQACIMGLLTYHLVSADQLAPWLVDGTLVAQQAKKWWAQPLKRDFCLSRCHAKPILSNIPSSSNPELVVDLWNHAERIACLSQCADCRRRFEMTSVPRLDKTQEHIGVDQNEHYHRSE